MTSTSHGTPQDTHRLSTLRALDDRVGAVRVEDVFDTDAQDLWSALVDPERLARWLGEVRGDLTVGGEFEARFTSSWTGPGRVEVCEPPQRLLVRLEPGSADETEVEATLTVDGDRTRLVIEERGLPIGVLPGHAAGWQAHVEDLGAHLSGRPAADWRSRWQELKPLYDEAGAAST
jgi:uncharacterized protein YndB with AHSA1/START domain